MAFDGVSVFTNVTTDLAVEKARSKLDDYCTLNSSTALTVLSGLDS